MEIEHVYSSDESTTESEPSRLITEEDYLDMLFFSCDVFKTGKVDVSTLIEYLRFTTSSVAEGQSDIDELAKMLDRHSINASIDIKSYRHVVGPWIQSLKQKSDGESGSDPSEETPVARGACNARTSTPTKQGTPILNLCSVSGGSLLGSGDGGLLLESDADMQQKMEELQFHNRRLADENATLHRQLEAAEETTNLINSQMEDLRKYLRSAQQSAEQVKLLKAENEELKGTLVSAEDSRRHLETSLLQAQRDGACVEQKVTTLENVISQLASEIDDLGKSKNNLQYSLATEKNRNDELQQMNYEKEMRLQENRQQLDELKRYAEEVNNINEKLKTERAELEIQLVETRHELDEACLRAELGQDVSMESASGDSPMPVGITPRVTATPIRTPSIATEIKSRLGGTPHMPLPLCAKELEDVFTQEEEEEGVEVTPGGKGEEQDLDLEVEAIMEASLRRDLFTCKVQEIAAEFEAKKDQVLEQITKLSQTSCAPGETAVNADILRTKLQGEIALFSTKITTLAAAKKSSDHKILRLSDALKKLKVHNQSLEEKHQRAVQQLEASSEGLQGAVVERLGNLAQQLEEERGQKAQLQQGLEETTQLLERHRSDLQSQSSTISDLLLQKQTLEEHIDRLESANASITEKYKRTEGQMSDLEHALDKNKQECSKEKKKTRELENGGPKGVNSDSMRDQVAKEIRCLRTQLERSQASLAAIQSRGLPLGRGSDRDWKEGQHSPGNSPLVEALTLDFQDANNQNGGGGSGGRGRRKEGCASADSILDGNGGGDLDGNGNFEYEQAKLLATSCPHLDSQRITVTSGTQTECPEYVKPRPPGIGATKYAVVNTSTGSSTSGVVDLDISSGSNKSEPHGVTHISSGTTKKSVLIVETACSPDTLPSSPEDPYDPLCRYRTSSFKRAIERGPSGDSSNQSFETADPASTSPDLTPDRPFLPPFPPGGGGGGGGGGNNPGGGGSSGTRDNGLLQPPPYREPSPQSHYSSLAGHHHHGHHQHHPQHHQQQHHRSAYGDQLNVSGVSSVDFSLSTSSAGPRDTSSSAGDTSWSTSPGQRRDLLQVIVVDDQANNRKVRTSTPADLTTGEGPEGTPAASSAEAASTTGTGSAAANTEDGRQSPQLLRRLSTLVEEGSDAEAEESLLSPRMRSVALPQPGRRAPRLLEVPPGKAPPPDYKAPPPEAKALPPGYKAPPPYTQALQSKRDTSPRSENRRTSPEPHDPSSSYRPLDRAAPPTVAVTVVSPQALMPNGVPASSSSSASPSQRPAQAGMPCKRTIFPPPGETAFPAKIDSYSPSVSPSRGNSPQPPPTTTVVASPGGRSPGDEPPGGGEAGEGRRGRSTARQLAKRNILQEARRTKDALLTTAKDGQVVDLVTGPLEEVELSEADKLLNAQLLEEARKTSAESRHKSRRLRKGSGSDLTRSQTFDDGEGEDMEEVFRPAPCPSTTAATPTDHAPRAGSVSSQPPRSPRASKEENLLKKRSLTKQSTMPELAESHEHQEGGPTPTTSSNTDMMNNHTEGKVNSTDHPTPSSSSSSLPAPSRASPTTTAAASAANSAFPSLPDETLQQLGLYRQKGDSLDLGEQLSDQEIEEKFACLALAFKTDKLTLEKRIDLHERARDIAEQNVNKEIEGLKEAMKTLSPFCTDAQSRDLYSKVQHHVEVLEQSTSRVSSRAEVHGAVQQELRMSKAIEVMVNHVENLKRLYDKEHQELEETKKLLQENKVISDKDGDGLQKRSYSLAGGGGLKQGGRRRASVAVFPRKLSTLGVGSSSPSPDLTMDPKTRFQTLVSDTALKASVLSGFRRSLSMEPRRSMDETKSDSSNSQVCGAKVNSSQGQNETTDKNGKSSLDSNSNIDEEAAFQKGYEEGVRAKLGAELAGLRQQQRIFYDNLENIVDQNEVSDEEEQRLKTTWAEVACRLWPSRVALSQKLRFTFAGFVFMLAVISLLFTLVPVGSASERKPRTYSWTSMEELVSQYVSVHHYEPPPI